MDLDIVAVALRVIRVLDHMGIRYVIVGSMASSVHGAVRSSFDVDLLADVSHHHIADLIEILEGEFYVDENAMHEAVERRSSFNLIDLNSAMKVDVFVPKAREFDRSQFERRERAVIGEGRDEEAYVATAEDTVLAKLDWYVQGGRTSERQWLDVRGILTVQRGLLDIDYLRQRAAELGVEDVLDAALRDAYEI